MDVWHQMNISYDIKMMLDKLKVRKREMDWAKLCRAFFMIATLISTFFALKYFNDAILGQTYSNAPAILSRLTETRFIVLLSLIAFSTGNFQYFSNRYKKKKEKYDNLRAETVQRLRVTWTASSLADKRDIISREMKSKYNINISFFN